MSGSLIVHVVPFLPWIVFGSKSFSIEAFGGSLRPVIGVAKE